MMSHRRRRISRVLLGVLAVVITVGVVTYARKLSATRANEMASSAAVATSQPQTQPQAQAQTQPSSPATAQIAGVKPIEPVKQALAQQASASGPLRTETPTVLATQASANLTPTPIPNAPPRQSTTPAPTKAVAASVTAPVADPSKVSIKPIPAPPAGHASVTTAEAIAQARAQVQAGKLLEARDTVNGPFVAGHLKGADADAARALLSEINPIVVFSTKKFADDRFGGSYQVQSGDRLDRIGAKYSVTSDLLMRINGLSDARRLRAGAYIKVLKGPFHAVVSKSAFRLDLYLGGLPGPNAADSVAYVASFPVGLGKDGSTPVGKWLVEPDHKVKNPVYYSSRGEGVVEADDPKNPLGEFWIGLTGLDGEAQGKESYGIHGTIDPDSIGKMASMGCIRLRNEDVAVVFSALTEGKSTVLVVE